MNNESKEKELNYTLNVEEQQKLVKQAEEILESFRKLDGEIKFSSRDFENRLNSLQGQINQCSESLNSCSKELTEKITNLAQETTILTTLPEKVGKHLKHLVPDISNNIETKLKGNLGISINNYAKLLDELSEKAKLTDKELQEIRQKSFKEKLLYLAMVLLVSIPSSVIGTYYLMQLFPQKVNIDAKGDITIEGGNISIWGTGKNGVQSSKKTENQ